MGMARDVRGYGCPFTTLGEVLMSYEFPLHLLLQGTLDSVQQICVPPRLQGMFGRYEMFIQHL